jgi:hypothetical protein
VRTRDNPKLKLLIVFKEQCFQKSATQPQTQNHKFSSIYLDNQQEPKHVILQKLSCSRSGTEPEKFIEGGGKITHKINTIKICYLTYKFYKLNIINS